MQIVYSEQQCIQNFTQRYTYVYCNIAVQRLDLDNMKIVIKKRVKSLQTTIHG